MEYKQLNLGINHLKGYKYISEALYIIDKEKFIAQDSIYALLSKKFKVSQNTIERDIRYAFSVARDKGGFTIVDKYLGYAQTGNIATLYYLYNALNTNDTKYNF